jgi:hypothetical protein
VPFDQGDLDGIVQHQARHHRVGDDRQRLRPRQRLEPRKAQARHGGSHHPFAQKTGHKCVAGHRRPEHASLARGHDGRHAEIERIRKLKVDSLDDAIKTDKIAAGLEKEAQQPSDIGECCFYLERYYSARGYLENAKARPYFTDAQPANGFLKSKVDQIERSLQTRARENEYFMVKKSDFLAEDAFPPNTNRIAELKRRVAKWGVEAAISECGTQGGAADRLGVALGTVRAIHLKKREGANPADDDDATF